MPDFWSMSQFWTVPLTPPPFLSTIIKSILTCSQIQFLIFDISISSWIVEFGVNRVPSVFCVLQTCLILAARSERGGCWPLTPTTPTWESSWGNGGGCRGVAFDKANDFGDAGVLIIVDPLYAVVIANLPHVFRQSFWLRPIEVIGDGNNVAARIESGGNLFVYPIILVVVVNTSV